jgi:hypothetical protein
MMSLGNEQWIRNLNELWLDPNENCHNFEEKQRPSYIHSLALTVSRWRTRVKAVMLSAR